MANRENVIDKLRKVWEHYEGAQAINSEEEANTAAALLQKMLIKHNITMDELQSSMSEKLAGQEVIEEYMSWYTKKSIGGEWEFQLMNVLCRYNLCRCFYNGKKKNKMMCILGRKENIEMVKWMHEMLKERYVRFSRDNYEKLIDTIDFLLAPIGLDTYQRRYLLGCSDGLGYKLAEQERKNRAEDKDFDTACTALVVRNTAALDTYIQEKWGKVGKTGSGHNLRNGAAYNKGVKDGYATELNKPLATSRASTDKLLG